MECCVVVEATSRCKAGLLLLLRGVAHAQEQTSHPERMFGALSSRLQNLSDGTFLSPRRIRDLISSPTPHRRRRHCRLHLHYPLGGTAAGSLMLLQSTLPAFPVCSNDEAVEVVLMGDQAKAEDGLLQVIRRTAMGSAASRWDASCAGIQQGDLKRAPSSADGDDIAVLITISTTQHPSRSKMLRTPQRMRCSPGPDLVKDGIEVQKDGAGRFLILYGVSNNL
ncbi:unnamed protein product [Miscanthus lutarioriparius]|uniref:Uncharacterized protein n=1 Tax=Miscanthus lutarioriparius TaxID=422564 RepID=A0A811PYP0_9POAL|nr:unnamed protein product [Miscanthus lutarioriparius]